MHVTLNMFTWVSFSRTFFCPLILCSSSLCCLGALHRKQNKYCCSVTKSCPALCKSMDCSTPVSAVLHYLPEFARIHVCWVGDAVQPSHPLLLSSSFALDLSQHQSFPGNRLFASGGQSIGALASVLPMKIQYWFPLGLTGLISLQNKGLSRIFSSSTIQTHQFFGAQTSLWSNSHICIWSLDFTGGSVVKNHPANAEAGRDAGLIPGSGRSPGGGNVNPLQFSCLENSHGQKDLVGYSPWCCRVGHDWVLSCRTSGEANTQV